MQENSFLNFKPISLIRKDFMNSVYRQKAGEISSALQNDIKFNKLLEQMRDLAQYIDFTDPSFSRACARHIFFYKYFYNF